MLQFNTESGSRTFVSEDFVVEDVRQYFGRSFLLNSVSRSVVIVVISGRFYRKILVRFILSVL